MFIAGYYYHGAPPLHDRPLGPCAICAGGLIAATAVLAGAVLPAVRAPRLAPVEELRQSEVSGQVSA